MVHEEQEHHQIMQTMASSNQELPVGWLNKKGQSEGNYSSAFSKNMVMSIRSKRKVFKMMVPSTRV